MPELSARTPGLAASSVRLSTGTIASPFVSSFTLDSPGVYMVTAMSQPTGSETHKSVSVWLVMWSGDLALDLLSAQQIGVTASSSGSSISGDIILSAPTAAGVVTATASWRGANAACFISVRMRKLSPFAGLAY